MSLTQCDRVCRCEYTVHHDGPCSMIVERDQEWTTAMGWSGGPLTPEVARQSMAEMNVIREQQHRAEVERLTRVKNAAEQLAAEHFNEIQRIRYLLWVGHGHNGRYGDDGEMQCGQCAPVWDYKRTPLEDVIAAALRNRAPNRRWVVEAAQPRTPRRCSSAPTDGRTHDRNGGEDRVGDLRAVRTRVGRQHQRRSVPASLEKL